MDEKSVFNLKQPCKNRGLEFVNNKNGTVNIGGEPFEHARDAENYLTTIPRTDIPCSNCEEPFDQQLEAMCHNCGQWSLG